MEQSLIKKVQVQIYTDERGCLSVIEGADTVPFEIKRVFISYAPAADARRGGHANIKSNIVMINISGACKVRVYSANRTETILLTEPMEGILLPAMTWKEISDYTPNSVILFLSDQHYCKDDYCYDFEQFLSESKKREAASAETVI
jgi:hypothetical protein